jgi:transcriptional regulator with XRE-family HTH domain
MLDQRFADLLRLARALVPGGVSQAALARLSGVNFTRISRLERGLVWPTIEEAARLADVLQRPELREVATQVEQAAAEGR